MQYINELFGKTKVPPLKHGTQFRKTLGALSQFSKCVSACLPLNACLALSLTRGLACAEKSPQCLAEQQVPIKWREIHLKRKYDFFFFRTQKNSCGFGFGFLILKSWLLL